MCILFILSGSPNECWLHTCDACVITTWRLGLWAPLVARNNFSTVRTIIALFSFVSQEDLTALGKYLAYLPVEPRIAKMIIYGAIFRCLDPILTIAAGLSYKDPFVTPLNCRLQADQVP